jgi:hypothetical protein
MAFSLQTVANRAHGQGFKIAVCQVGAAWAYTAMNFWEDSRVPVSEDTPFVSNPFLPLHRVKTSS